MAGLELYPRIERLEVFEIGSTLATFVATLTDETLLMGLYQEVVNSDAAIERVEEAWKQKLMNRRFGLNKN